MITIITHIHESFCLITLWEADFFDLWSWSVNFVKKFRITLLRIVHPISIICHPRCKCTFYNDTVMGKERKLKLANIDYLYLVFLTSLDYKLGVCWYYRNCSGIICDYIYSEWWDEKMHEKGAWSLNLKLYFGFRGINYKKTSFVFLPIKCHWKINAWEDHILKLLYLKCTQISVSRPTPHPGICFQGSICRT